MIELREISKSYPMGSSEILALKNVTLSVEKGDFVSIVGPSGSGKSTLMNIIGCLDKPSSGSYQLDGILVSNMSGDDLAQVRNRKIGFVFQTFNLLARQTAVDNVSLPLLYAGLNRSKRRERAMESLKWVELSGRASHRPTELSGGERQRVAIARALVNEPSILLADEPTGNLDQKVGKEIISIFLRLNLEAQVTVVLVTHDREVASLARRKVEIIDGEIVSDTTNPKFPKSP